MIPASVTTEDLETNLRLLKQYIDEPPSFEDGKSAAELLRRKAAPKPSYDDISGSDASDSDGSESSDKPRKPSKKRKRRQVDDAELEARREHRRLADMEKRLMIKSAVRIVDSDEDEETDVAFFERERTLRERMAKKALEGDLPESGTRVKAKKTGPAVSKRQAVSSPVVSDGDDDVQILGSEVAKDWRDEGSENEDIESVRPSKKHKVRRAVEISSDEE
jgi:replication fork protection complex subunit Tof1/Swi1